MKPEDYLDKHSKTDYAKLQRERPILAYNLTNDLRGYAKAILIKQLEHLEEIRYYQDEEALEEYLQERLKQLKQNGKGQD